MRFLILFILLIEVLGLAPPHPHKTIVPDIKKRIAMNYILVFGGAVPITVGLGLPFVLFFVPKNKSGGDISQFALDRNGNSVTKIGWLKEHGPNSRSLVQGLNGDATYLLVDQNNEIRDFGVNAVCTHLGCVVPWNSAENKFMCPCHGSQYNADGKVVRGPAPLSLALSHVNIDGDDKVTFKKWSETDFRTNESPWWK